MAEGSAGAVTMLWMLYHLDVPRLALLEARRVLRRGGLLAACTAILNLGATHPGRVVACQGAM